MAKTEETFDRLLNPKLRAAAAFHIAEERAVLRLQIDVDPCAQHVAGAVDAGLELVEAPQEGLGCASRRGEASVEEAGQTREPIDPPLADIAEAPHHHRHRRRQH